MGSTTISISPPRPPHLKSFTGHLCSTIEAHRWFERGLLRSRLNLMQDIRCFRIKNRNWLFVGPETSHLWRLVENEVYDERLELRRWYLTFAKHDACISEGGPSCRCLPLKPIGSVFESWYKRGPEQSPRPLFSAALLQCTAWIAFPRAPSSRHVEVTRPDVEPATGIIKPGSAGGPH